MSGAAIQFTDVVKSYRSPVALDGFSLRIAKGDCLALAGVNGAGKTTLLKCLLDLLPLDSGRVEIFGVDHGKTASRAPLAFLPGRFVPTYYLTAVSPRWNGLPKILGTCPSSANTASYP